MVAVNFTVEADLIGLSTEIEGVTGNEVTLDDGTLYEVTDGSTFLAVDTSQLYIFYRDTWYEQ